MSYCATCDADFHRPWVVVVGGDSAIQEAIYHQVCRKGYRYPPRDEPSVPSPSRKGLSNPKIDFIWDSVVIEIKGDGIVESVVVKNVKTNEVKEVQTDGCSCSSV